MCAEPDVEDTSSPTARPHVYSEGQVARSRTLCIDENTTTDALQLHMCRLFQLAEVVGRLPAAGYQAFETCAHKPKQRRKSHDSLKLRGVVQSLVHDCLGGNARSTTCA